MACPFRLTPQSALAKVTGPFFTERLLVIELSAEPQAAGGRGRGVEGNQTNCQSADLDSDRPREVRTMPCPSRSILRPAL